MISRAALEHVRRWDCYLQGDVAIPQPPAEADEGLGALEAVERLEGSPVLEDRPDQPLLPGREHHWGKACTPLACNWECSSLSCISLSEMWSQLRVSRHPGLQAQLTVTHNKSKLLSVVPVSLFSSVGRTDLTMSLSCKCGSSRTVSC